MSIAALINCEAERGPNETEQTTPSELEVFGLKQALVPALRDGYWRYMDYLELVIPPFFGKQAEADRKNHPGYVMVNDEGQPIFSNHMAAKFMSEVAGLPYTQAYRFCVKVEMAQWRVGIITVQE